MSWAPNLLSDNPEESVNLKPVDLSKRHSLARVFSAAPKGTKLVNVTLVTDRNTVNPGSILTGKVHINVKSGSKVKLGYMSLALTGFEGNASSFFKTVQFTLQSFTETKKNTKEMSFLKRFIRSRLSICLQRMLSLQAALISTVSLSIINLY